MAISILDFFDFRFNNGRGLRADQIDGGGMQTYFALTTSWDNEAAPTELRLSQFIGPHGIVDLVGQRGIMLFRAPATTPRGATELTARVGTEGGLRVRDLHDGPLRARDLTPNALYEAYYSAGSPGTLLWVEEIGVRPQDFDIWLGWFLTPFDNAAIAAGDTYSTADVTIPSHPTQPPPFPAFLVLGVPETAPPVAAFERTGEVGTQLDLRVATFINGLGLSVGGVPFTWYGVGPAGGLNPQETQGAPVGRTYRVIYGRYP